MTEFDKEKLENEKKLSMLVRHRGCGGLKREIEHGITLNNGDLPSGRNGESLVASAIVSGAVEELKILLNSGYSANQVAKNGHRPLLTALYERDVECMKILLDFGADLKLAASENEGINILGYAVRDGGEELDFLIDAFKKKGLDLDEKMENGRSALMEAALAGNEDSVEKLVLAGARDFGGGIKVKVKM